MSPLKTFIARPVFTTMLMAAVVVFGVFSYPRIGVDQFPDVEFPVVTVTTLLPGADPETIEKNISDPLEEAVNTLNGVDTLNSVSMESVSQVTVQFTLGTNPEIAAQDVRDRVQATLQQLPDEIETPVVEKFDIGAAPILTLSLAGSLPIEELTRVAEDVVKPALQRQDGVGSITVVGGRERQVQLVVDPQRLRGYGLGISDVSQAVAAQNLDVPGGRAIDSGRERVVRMTSEVKSVEQLRNLIIASPQGAPIRVRDVASVVDGPEEARGSASEAGASAVALIIRKQSGSNTVQVARNVTDSLAELNTSLEARGVRVSTVSDNSRFIRASIASVQFDMILGGVLAVVIVLVFLRNLRSTLVAAIALPISVIGTFAVMAVLGFTFNMITMLALTLSIGLLIDDAIVVIENIVRHMEEGKTPAQAALEGTGQIAVAVLAVTLAIVAVFIPVAFMQGMIGQFFFQFGVTVAVSVIISYAVSMILTPMLSSRILREHAGPGNRVSAAIERGLIGIENGYRKILGKILDWRWLSLGIAMGVLVLTVFMAGLLKFTFIPASDNGNIRVAVELPIGSRLEDTQKIVEELDDQVRQVPGVASTFITIGGGVQEQVNKGEILVNLVPVKQRKFTQEEFKDYLRQSLPQRSDVNVAFLDVSSVGGGGATQAVQFNLRGDDWKELIAASETMRQVMLKNPGLVDVDTTYRSGKPQYDVEVDRERAAQLGIVSAQLGSTLRAFLGKDKFADYREKGETYEVTLRLPDAMLASEDALGQLPVRAADGTLVELRTIARVIRSEGPVQINRQSQKRQITMLANLAGTYSLGEAINFLNAQAQKELPPSITSEVAGNAKELNKTVGAFVQALLLGIVLLYMILAAQFESYIHPFTIMVSLPFSFIGAVGALLISGQAMSMFGFIGIIMLMGLVVKNGILVVDFTQQMREEGKSTREALLAAAPVRLRPILMTTVAMIAGMVPVALARGDGAESRVPMALVIIGGLVTSTVLTLGVVPVVYSLLDGLSERFKRRKARYGAPHHPVEEGAP
ncbi:efflux RND transporter permease subunit [Hyalangium versicolor]|uniref:efflux RND transporter permease subunit n=1 Tax=Hyalangium versicolor TaxID=2861190 RepID=UPI001CC91BE8|nr:efflux RND transporter permease subunit [Hyalangium versicolor]